MESNERSNVHGQLLALSETEIQQARFLLGGKGGDGDPPYARDMRSRQMKIHEEARNLCQYRWAGD